MPRQFGKVDVSATWTPCERCPHKHPAHVACPPTGVWLVLELCPDCRPVKQLYCRVHRDRHVPETTPYVLPDEADSRQRAAGEGGQG